jgi:16S rRNA (guanine1516-N2)-methyltransferase
MVERSPLISLLLEDGLQRARLDAEVGPIVSRMTLHAQEGVCWLNTLSEIERPDVIYVDPMFPHSEKSALVKKEMRLFREVVGDDEDAEALLAAALEQARFRVVVKRPRKAPCLGGQKPGYQLEGKSGRFDIYPLKAMTPGLV